MELLQRFEQLLVESSAFDKVEHAIELTDLEGRAIKGSSSVWYGELNGSPVQATQDLGVTLQDERQVFGVVIGVKAVNDRKGTKANQILQAKREVVRGLFFGLEHATYHPMLLAGASMLAFKDGSLFWIERFATQTTISQENLL